MIETRNDPAGADATTVSASRRHDMVTSAHGIPSARHAASSSAAPGRQGRLRSTRSMTPSRRRSTITVRFEIDTGSVAEGNRRIEEIEPDDRQGVVVGPGAPELGDERVLALDPVGLGVDERAVHVPQDRSRTRRRLSSHRSSSAFSTTSVSAGWIHICSLAISSTV